MNKTLNTVYKSSDRSADINPHIIHTTFKIKYILMPERMAHRWHQYLHDLSPIISNKGNYFREQSNPLLSLLNHHKYRWYCCSWNVLSIIMIHYSYISHNHNRCQVMFKSWWISSYQGYSANPHQMFSSFILSVQTQYITARIYRKACLCMMICELVISELICVHVG